MTICLRLFLIVLSSWVLAACNPSGDQLVRKAGAEKIVSEEGEATFLEELSGTRILDSTTREILANYGPSIRVYSARYDLDWRLVLAVMKCESGFNVDAVSERGARGLMQIMPTTGREVGEVLETDVWSHPVANIHGGVFYLRKLYSMYSAAEPAERVKLTLAAYNAGIGRVSDARDVAVYLREDPNRWDSVSDALSLLSKRFYTLHGSVWSGGQPESGWFSGSDETIEYVAKVVKYYDEYRLMLN